MYSRLAPQNLASCRHMKLTSFLVLLLTALFCAVSAHRGVADTFGSGPNTFDIEFVDVGNSGNAADTTGSPNPAGSVAEAYRMGKFEISEQMIDKANALGGLGITTYVFSSLGPNKPATTVSWNDAARFVNWLNTSSGSTPAYKFALQPGEVGYSANTNIQLWDPGDGGYNPNNQYRNSLARYFLPSVDEWYKAAYYDPTSGVYYNYPTGSDTAPTAVASGTTAGTAVYGQFLATDGPADITLAGGLSPYGTMAQGGNVWEWEETDFDLVNDSSPSDRGSGIRGGSWGSFDFLMDASTRSQLFPLGTSEVIGFRVASIPESIVFDFAGNSSDGHPVSGSAEFTKNAAADTVTVKLTNTTATTLDAGELFTSLDFTLGGLTPTMTSDTGIQRTVARNGSFSDTDTAQNLSWSLLSLGSGSYQLNFNPDAKDAILGPPSDGNYEGSNTSIIGNIGHNPFAAEMAVFQLSVPGLEANTPVSITTFGYGKANLDPATVPEPSALMLAILGLGLVAGRRLSRPSPRKGGITNLAFQVVPEPSSFVLTAVFLFTSLSFARGWLSARG